MSYIQIYHKIGAKRAIKGLQKAVVESQIPQKRHRALSTIWSSINIRCLCNKQGNDVHWYNSKKVHQGLNWQTPFDFIQQSLMLQKSNML
jgi:hypothetical protein